MKIENLTCNSTISFIGYSENKTIHGIKVQDNISIRTDYNFLTQIDIELFELKKSDEEILLEGNYLTISYSTDHEDQESMDLLFQKFFTGFEYPADENQIEIIFNILRRFKSKTKSIIGLIGELLFILSREDKNSAVLAWHTTKDSIFDFNFTNEIYEIKCTTNLQRKHKLNLYQNNNLVKVDDKKTFYTSVILNRNFPTDNIINLIERITIALEPNIEQIFRHKLDPYEELIQTKMKFDISSSLISIKHFEASLFSDLISHNEKIASTDVNFSLNFNLLQ